MGWVIMTYTLCSIKSGAWSILSHLLYVLNDLKTGENPWFLNVCLHINTRLLILTLTHVLNGTLDIILYY